MRDTIPLRAICGLVASSYGTGWTPRVPLEVLRRSEAIRGLSVLWGICSDCNG